MTNKTVRVSYHSPPVSYPFLIYFSINMAQKYCKNLICVVAETHNIALPFELADITREYVFNENQRKINKDINKVCFRTVHLFRRSLRVYVVKKQPHFALEICRRGNLTRLSRESLLFRKYFGKYFKT